MCCIKQSSLFLIVILVTVFMSSLFICSDVYASSYTITSTNVDEFLNYYGNWNNPPSLATIKSRFNNYLNTYNSQYNNSFIEVYSLNNGKNFFYLYFFNNENITYANYTNTRNWRIEGTGIIRCSPLENYVLNIGSYVSANTSRGQYFMISNPVLNIVTAPYQSSNVMTFITDYFEYNYNINLDNIYIDEDFPSIKQLNYGISGDIAEFGLTSYLDNVTLTYWKYEKDRGYFEPLFVKDVTSYSIIDNSLGYLYSFKSDFIPNTIMQYTLESNDLESFSSLGVTFYAVDSNTIISNGNLNINDTFNDDYYSRYNIMINNITSNSGGMITSPSGDVTGFIDLEPIKNSIDNLYNDDNAQNIINEYLSGDVDDLIGQIWGYSEGLQNPFTSFLLDFAYDIYAELTTRESVQINLNTAYTENMYINTDDFVTPETPLKQIVRLMLIFIWIYGNYRFFHHIYDLTKTAKLDALIAQLGTDEFYDTDYM